MNNMQSIFLLGEGDRAAFLQHMMQSLGCSYVCLWSNVPLPSNCLVYLDGVSKQQSHVARRLFGAYCESINYVDQGRFPGFAFKNNLPYVEFRSQSLLKHASSQVQIQFYQEAGIKIVVFMGCAIGEIELGLSKEAQVDLQTEIQNWFATDFSGGSAAPGELVQLTNCSLHSTSSTLTVDSSTDYSYSYNILSPSPVEELTYEALLQEALVQCNVQNLRGGAFTTYRKTAPAVADERGSCQGRHSMFKRSVLFFRNLSMSNRQGNRPTPTQVHHMISERRRREKLNESFRVLRSLLPPGSKKDKASVLNTITDHLTSLKSQVEELERRNRELEAQLSTVEKVGTMTVPSLSTNGTANVTISHDLDSTSGGQSLTLSVGLSSGELGPLDLTNRVLKLLKEQKDVKLLSIQSNTKMVEANSLHGLVLRFNFEGDVEFDDSDFQQAVTKILT